jgi:hypothetical protein
MKDRLLNRRQWTLLLGAAPVVSAQPSNPAAAEETAQARERLARAGAEVRKVKLDPRVEPAFRFKA